MLASRHDISPSLSHADVAVIGVGGLGTAAAQVLAESGIGRLRLWDHDVVDASNLHRQLLYTDADVGRPKVDIAAERLRARRPTLELATDPRRFAPADAALLAGADVIIDGTDSIAAKFTVNDAAVQIGVPLIHAGATGLRAQLLTIIPGQSTCYRCVFEDPPPGDDVPTCQEAGILGPVVNLVGTLQAEEALRILAGAPPRFADRIVTFDAWTGTSRVTPVSPRPACPACRRYASTTRSFQ